MVAIDLTVPQRGSGTVSLSTVREALERCPAGEILRRSDEHYRLLFESNPVAMWVFDRKTLRFLAVNDAAIRQYGFTREEFLARTIAEIRPEEDVSRMLQDVGNLAPGLGARGLWRHSRKDGTVIQVEIASHPLDFHGVECVLVAAQDITERKRAEEAVRQAEEKYRGIFENAVIGIFQATLNGRLVSINRALAHMHGYDSPEEIMAEVTNVAEQLFVKPDQLFELRQMAARGIVRGAEVEIRIKDGTRKWGRVNLRAIRDAEGSVVLYEGTVEDITEQKAAQERMKFLAFYDALTELPHRALLQDRLETALAGARRRGERVALLFLDLDRFKAINDSFGHAFGDLVLKEVAKRLKACMRDHTVARVGGDEFLILLSSLKDPADAAIAAERVMRAMSAGFKVQKRTVSVGCSVGVSIFPDHGRDADALIRNADAAMYSAKDGGRSNVQFFTDAMNAQAVERLTMEKNLRLAMERNEFSLMYQPQMEIESGAITGFEALLRWNQPELGAIAPDRFIAIAENNGMILPIGEWVLRSACAQARKWQDEGLCCLPVAVNVSAVQFRQEGFRSMIARVLEETGLAPQYLQLELTESVLLSDTDVTLSVLQELKGMGVQLSIDDFGTGYSSFSYLRHFNVDKLKIDRSFIDQVASKTDDAAITIAIISLAKSLRVKVIAEGVETEAQMSFLRAHGCDEIQGYYYSKAVSAGEAAVMLHREQSSGLAAKLRTATADTPPCLAEPQCAAGASLSPELASVRAGCSSDFS